jgi:hypothetical protein
MFMGNRQAKYAMVFASAFALTFGPQARAASGMGQASAMVIREIVSMPIVIRMLAPQLSVQNTSAGFSFTGYQSTGDGSGGSSESGLTLVGIDAAGVATFSVSGDTTSGYVVQAAASDGPNGPNGLSEVSASESAGTSNGEDDPNAAAELIVPAQALIGGGRLSIVVSQASTKGRSGEMNVQINYN